MSGFSQESNAFLQALARNNNREWFTANKARYEDAIKVPAIAFAEDMAAELKSLTGIAHDPKIFRIYRDVRFSKDKTPYNTHLRMSFIPVQGPATRPAWHFSLEQDHLVLGTGVFGYQKGDLDRFRTRIAGPDGARLKVILGKLTRHGARLSDPDLKRVPAPYEADHPQADLLRHKGLAAWIDLDDAAMAHGRNAVKNCLKQYRTVQPLFDWLMEIEMQ